MNNYNPEIIKELEETNKRIENLERLKSKFLSIVSHELKSSLAAVQNYLRIILDGLTGDITDKQRNMLERSSIRINELIKLIDNLLDLRIEKEQIMKEMKQVSLRRIIEDSIKEIQNEAADKKINLKIELPHNLPEIYVNSNRLQQVFHNLLKNAIQFSQINDEVIVKVEEKNNYIQVEIIDNGIGIANSDLPYIFEEFYRGKDVETKGLGLGLSIVKKIIEAHNGKIWAESKGKGKGTKLIFTLPC